MLKMEHLTKTYGEKKAVEDLSLHIHPGEIYGFIGHNGAGKTTLLSLLSGEDEPSDGTFSFAKGVRIGYLKQSDHFDAKGTVLGEMQAVYEEASSHREEWGISIYESEVRGILTSMGFPESFYCKPISSLSSICFCSCVYFSLDLSYSLSGYLHISIILLCFTKLIIYF